MKIVSLVVLLFALSITTGCSHNKPVQEKEKVVQVTKEGYDANLNNAEKQKKLANDQETLKAIKTLEENIDMISKISKKYPQTSVFNTQLLKIKSDLSKVLAQAKTENNTDYINEFVVYAQDYAWFIESYLSMDARIGKAKTCFDISSNEGEKEPLNLVQKDYLSKYLAFQVQVADANNPLMIKKYELLRSLYFGKVVKESTLTDSQKNLVSQANKSISDKAAELSKREEEARVIKTDCDFNLLTDAYYEDLWRVK